MDKKYAKNGKFKAFLKRNMYYIIMAVCILAIGGMITAAVLTQQTDPVDNNQQPLDPGDPTDGDPTDPTDNDPDPIIDPIIFTAPVAGGQIVQDYAMDSHVFWSTLGHYAVHDGIDFGGEEGAAVVAAYDGKVLSLDYDVLYGNVVTIDHGKGLVTSYGSLGEPLVTVGQEVKAGDQIGGISASASNEMLLGPHVHFSVFLDQEVVSPYEYLPDGDK